MNKFYGTAGFIADEYLDIDGKYSLSGLLGIGFKEAVANPVGEIGLDDCMIRSIAILLNYPNFDIAISQYKEIYHQLAKIGEEKMILMNHVAVAEEYLKNKGYMLVNYQASMGLGQFLTTHKLGHFIVCTGSGHAFPYIDGTIYDSLSAFMTIEHEYGHEITYVYCKREEFNLL